MSKIEPITPAAMVGKKQDTLPDEVIEAFNELIAENWKGTYANVFQKDAISRIRKKIKKRVTGDQICDNGWLDVEDIFRKAGWDVEFDNPGYNETYDASFTFSKRKK